MELLFHPYRGGLAENTDYNRLHDFLAETQNKAYTYGRLDWMLINRDYLEAEYLPRIGVWEADGRVVGATLFDHSLDDIFPVVREGYESLYPQMLSYAAEQMQKPLQPDFRVCIGDTNTALQAAARGIGLKPLAEKESVAQIDLRKPLPEIALPTGYRFTSLAETPDYERYLYCLFRGFNHEADGEVFSFTAADAERNRMAYEMPFVNRSLKVSVVSPSGDYVAHTGLWYDPAAGFALVEPVCTVPEARLHGFGRAVVWAALRRVQKLGATAAVVGSDQAFYAAIGFCPYCTSTFWAF